MQWLEISIEAGQEGTEALCELLNSLEVSGLVIEDGSDLEDFIENYKQYWDYIDEDFINKRRSQHLVKFYLSDDEDGRNTLNALRPRLESAGYTLSVTSMRDEDWENNWKRYYKPIRVGKKLLIVPEWEETPENNDLFILRLNPGLIFGTGSHPSTRMCLEAMEDRAPSAQSVLDLGCGSGILAIAALVLGAKEAYGCDIDEKAPSTALSNAALNGLGEDRFKVEAGNVLSDLNLREKIGSKSYDIIFANIVADVVIALCPDAAAWLKEDGLFICSGIIDGREEEAEKAIMAAGMRIIKHSHIDNWHGYTAVRNI
ncbi:MAG: 50S ribosomal protein L11 methyltransferase [Papillibacter sp.]|nr:50S ribosomal protein L11 methyltransferase [Papillibacter sp.]